MWRWSLVTSSCARSLARSQPAEPMVSGPDARWHRRRMSRSTNELTLAPVEQLLAIEEIKDVFAGRLRCMDTKDWGRYGDFHTEDVVSDSWRGLPDDKQPITDGKNVVIGRERLSATIRALLDGPVRITSVHHGHTPEIELTSNTTARGVWGDGGPVVVDQRRSRDIPAWLRPLPRGWTAHRGSTRFWATGCDGDPVTGEATREHTQTDVLQEKVESRPAKGASRRSRA